MANSFHKIFFLLLIAATFLSSQAQQNDSLIIQQIISIAKAKGEAMSTLRVLTDSIGARITGSTQSRMASAFLLKKLRQLGYSNAREEDYELATRWTRHTAAGKILSPTRQPLMLGSYAWAPGTKGEVIANVVDLGSLTDENFPGQLHALNGAVVIAEPSNVVVRSKLADFLAKAGAAAMLIPSDKPQRMLYTSGYGFYPGAPLPVLSVAQEDILLLRRLLEHNPVKISLHIQNTLTYKPSKEVNIIADIPGSTNETILIGAHFDSWDYAQGAQDNGSGVAAIMEVARIFKLLNIKPKRTIRFAFFSGEEQGCLGSYAYTFKHANELDQLKMVLIMDNGAYKPKGFLTHGRIDIREMAKEKFRTLSSLNADTISTEANFDTDHGPFIVKGIPGLTLWVEPGDYDIHHHTISDTYDKVNATFLASDVAVMAVAAYILAQSQDDIGHRLSKNDAEVLLKNNGLLPEYEMDKRTLEWKKQKSKN